MGGMKSLILYKPIILVVLEHDQKLFTIHERIGFQPPVTNGWKVSDISKRV